MRLNHYGFSLIEVMIAMAIFSIAILGMSAMMITAVQSVTLSRNRTTAVTLARDKMENLKRQADAAPPLLTSANNSPGDCVDNQPASIVNFFQADGDRCDENIPVLNIPSECLLNGYSYCRIVTITDTSAPPQPVAAGAGAGVLITINVAITWTDFSLHTLTQTTFISQ